MYTRLYARIAGALLLLLGIATLLAGAPREGFLGLFYAGLSEDLVHVAIGTLFLYLGYADIDRPMLRTIVGTTGVVLLLAGFVGFLSPQLFGLLPGGLRPADSILHVLLGVMGIAAAFFLPGPSEPHRASEGQARGSGLPPDR